MEIYVEAGPHGKTKSLRIVYLFKKKKSLKNKNMLLVYLHLFLELLLLCTISILN